MALKQFKTPFTNIELTESLNENFTAIEQDKADITDLSDYIPKTDKGVANGTATLDANKKVNETAKTADTAKNYDVTDGTIKTAIEDGQSAVLNITNGTTTVGKAKALNPDTAPGNNKYYGTSPSGTIGWYDYDDGSGQAPAVGREDFTDSDQKWSSISNGVYTLTIPHSNKYPLGVFKIDGSDYAQVQVDVVRNNSNVLIRSHNKFTGYVQLG